jgi:SAM-dependent methyltransferase
MDQVARYHSALRHVPASRADAPVLDVGCGTTGACRHAGGVFFGTDLHFTDYRDEAPRLHHRLRAVRADATALPFADRAFDCVLSLDLLEHVPVEQRAAVVAELRRTARRRVVVGCPVFEGWDRWESRLLGVYRRSGKKMPGWLLEHRERGLPRQDELLRIAAAPGWTVRAEGNVNGFVYFCILVAEMTPVGWLAARVMGEASDGGPGFAARAFGRLCGLLSFGNTARTILVLERVTP